MKKLTLLMIFVLLFSITILAGDLSKEGIIAELEKITVITNRDIRLKMYDILAGKLGLKVADDTIINEFSGSGTQTTRPFIAETAWEVRWNTKAEDFMLFQVYLYDGNGNLAGVVANQTKPGKGSFYNPKKGTFYLSINVVCDWEIKIIVVE